jgi:hypothetical protein
MAVQFIRTTFATFPFGSNAWLTQTLTNPGAAIFLCPLLQVRHGGIPGCGLQGACVPFVP